MYNCVIFNTVLPLQNFLLLWISFWLANKNLLWMYHATSPFLSSLVMEQLGAHISELKISSRSHVSTTRIMILKLTPSMLHCKLVNYVLRGEPHWEHITKGRFISNHLFWTCRVLGIPCDKRTCPSLTKRSNYWMSMCKTVYSTNLPRHRQQGAKYNYTHDKHGVL